MGEKKILTTGEAAKFCGVNFRTVIRWIERGHLKAYQLPGRGDNRIRVDDFRSFLRDNGIPIPDELKPDIQTILVVDDDIQMAGAIERVLIREGYNVQVAHNGFQAGMVIGPLNPVLITLDLKMPSLDGFYVLDYLQENQLPIKKLVVSGLPTKELEKALVAGADDVLKKPFDNDTLIDKVAQLLNTD